MLVPGNEVPFRQEETEVNGVAKETWGCAFPPQPGGAVLQAAKVGAFFSCQEKHPHSTAYTERFRDRARNRNGELKSLAL